MWDSQNETAHQRQNRKRIAEKGTPHVTHKNARRWPVVTKEAKATRRQKQSKNGDKALSSLPTQPHPTESSYHSLSRCNAINPIHKVVGVGQSDNPKKSNRYCQQT